MYEFLEGFHQRMQLIGVVDALINRRNKKVELEHPIGDKEFETSFSPCWSLSWKRP